MTSITGILILSVLCWTLLGNSDYVNAISSETSMDQSLAKKEAAKPRLMVVVYEFLRSSRRHNQLRQQSELNSSSALPLYASKSSKTSRRRRSILQADQDNDIKKVKDYATEVKNRNTKDAQAHASLKSAGTHIVAAALHSTKNSEESPTPEVKKVKEEKIQNNVKTPSENLPEVSEGIKENDLIEKLVQSYPGMESRNVIKEQEQAGKHNKKAKVEVKITDVPEPRKQKDRIIRVKIPTTTPEPTKPPEIRTVVVEPKRPNLTQKITYKIPIFILIPWLQKGVQVASGAKSSQKQDMVESLSEQLSSPKTPIQPPYILKLGQINSEQSSSESGSKPSTESMTPPYISYVLPMSVEGRSQSQDTMENDDDEPLPSGKADQDEKDQESETTESVTKPQVHTHIVAAAVHHSTKNSDDSPTPESVVQSKTPSSKSKEKVPKVTKSDVKKPVTSSSPQVGTTKVPAQSSKSLNLSKNRQLGSDETSPQNRAPQKKKLKKDDKGKKSNNTSLPQSIKTAFRKIIKPFKSKPKEAKPQKGKQKPKSQKASSNTTATPKEQSKKKEGATITLSRTKAHIRAQRAIGPGEEDKKKKKKLAAGNPRKKHKIQIAGKKKKKNPREKELGVESSAYFVAFNVLSITVPLFLTMVSLKC